MTKSAFPLVTIVGNIGSGKSTAMPVVTKALEALPLYADDLFQTTDPFAQKYLEDTPRWAFANELWLTYERSQLIHRHMETHPERLHVVDSGLLMSWVYTRSHLIVENITIDEWELYEKLYTNLANGLLLNSCVIRLNYSVETLMSRIKKRGRDFELEFYTSEYLSQIEEGLAALQKKLQQANVKVIEITEKEIADFEHNPEDATKLVELIKAGLEPKAKRGKLK